MNSNHLYPLQLMVQGNLEEPLSLLDVIECLKMARSIALNQPQITQYSHVDDVVRTFVYAMHTHFDLPGFDAYNPVRNLQLRAVITCINNILEMITTDSELLTDRSCIFEKTIQQLEHVFCETNDQQIDKTQIQQSRMILAGLCPVYTFTTRKNQDEIK